MTNLLVGTSGWQFPALKAQSHVASGTYSDLEYYGSLFSTVENNSAFYHIPKASTLKKWYDSSPDNFIFSIKLHRQFTHDHHLQLTIERIALLDEFLHNTQELKEKLGAILIQTPPGLPYQLDLLKNFVRTIKELVNQLSYKPDIAVEFRNTRWFTKETYALLKSYNIALVISDSSIYPFHPIITADFTYIRLHGPDALFRSTYSDMQLGIWRKRIESYATLRRVYAYFNNTLSDSIITNAQLLKS